MSPPTIALSTPEMVASRSETNASDWLADDHALPPTKIMRRMMQVHVCAPYQMNFNTPSTICWAVHTLPDAFCLWTVAVTYADRT